MERVLCPSHISRVQRHVARQNEEAIVLSVDLAAADVYRAKRGNGKAGVENLICHIANDRADNSSQSPKRQFCNVPDRRIFDRSVEFEASHVADKTGLTRVDLSVQMHKRRGLPPENRKRNADTRQKKHLRT